MENFEEFDLSEKERLFCENYVVYASKKKAAEAAGYSGVNASQSGVQVLRQPGVKEYITWLRQRAAEVAGVTLIRNAMELAKVAYGNASNLRTDWMQVKDWDEITDEEKSILSEVKSEIKTVYDKQGNPITTETLHIKTHDKLKAIEMLNKMFAFNQPDKVEHTGENGGPIQVTGMIIKKE